MKRRECLILVAWAIGWPLAARAQQSVPVIGFLNSQSPVTFGHLADAFRQGLQEAGFSDGRNVVIEYRWAEGKIDRLPEMAAELVGRGVSVLVATGGEPAGMAAKAATSNLPVVFAIGGDPVKVGLVSSLNRPGGNMTGLTQFTEPLEAKRFSLLRELMPAATTIAALINPRVPAAESQLGELRHASAAAGVQLVALTATDESEFDAAFAELVRQRAEALIVCSDPYFNSRRDRLVSLAARHRIPAIYEFREFTAAGGLMSYGASLSDGYRQVGIYTGRILKGAEPAELPVLQPTRFELVINLRTAEALEIELPPSLLARADEVIE
jgi:putative ABC transport system substrate-binding protein